MKLTPIGPRVCLALLSSMMVAAGVPAAADPMSCNLAGYRATSGLSAASADHALTVSWEGERDQRLRLRFGITGGTPMIQELALRRGGGAWNVLATNVTPEVRVVSGLRRISNQQLTPLRGLGVDLTADIIDKYRWEPFWDAPLDLDSPVGRGGNPPPAAGVANSPGLPRKAEEIRRSLAVFHATGCDVKTNGARLEVTFPGAQAGVFNGSLQFSIFKGTNLIQQEFVATTNEPWVAYKYDAGLRGITASGSRVVWRDTSSRWQESRPADMKVAQEVALTALNRLVVAERGTAGSIAVFPPPHTFFWAREIAINLGYNWYRRDSDASISIGIRQAEKEHESENPANFALYSARPGSVQRMTMFIYPSVEAAQPAFESALAFTHGDRYKPLAGYQVMNHHYHMDLGQRLGQAGLDAEIPDLVALKALGLNIVSPIDSITGGGEGTPPGATYPGAAPVRGRGANPGAAPAGRGNAPPAAPGSRPGPVDPAPQTAAQPAQAATPAGRGRGASPLEIRYNSIEGAKRHSDATFLVLPSQEYYGSPLGGHTDLIFSHPVYWLQGREAGQPFEETDPKYGKVYRIGNADDLMEMARREEILINMPHPRTKGSTGFPDSVKDLPFFMDPHYQGIGFRWGMGLDRSERRLCEYRCQPLIDDMSNWMVSMDAPLKKILSISEVRHMAPGDDIYSSQPVTYVKLDTLPRGEDHSTIVRALMRGDSFVTSGEVLISSSSVSGSGSRRTLVADVEWTFPLDFVEVITGDGSRTDRDIVSATDVLPMSRKRFQVPFDAAGRKWVRFAVWDTAGNGAMTQPMKLE